MIAAVDGVLNEIGADQAPRLLVLGKIDLVDVERRGELELEHPDSLSVSALTSEGLDALRVRIEEEFARTLEPVELLIPYDEGSTLAELHELAGDLIREDTPDGVRVLARLPAGVAPRYARLTPSGRPV
jgi:GTP-binding protein HflX